MFATEERDGMVENVGIYVHDQKTKRSFVMNPELKSARIHHLEDGGKVYELFDSRESYVYSELQEELTGYRFLLADEHGKIVAAGRPRVIMAYDMDTDESSVSKVSVNFRGFEQFRGKDEHPGFTFVGEFQADDLVATQTDAPQIELFDIVNGEVVPKNEVVSTSGMDAMFQLLASVEKDDQKTVSMAPIDVFQNNIRTLISEWVVVNKATVEAERQEALARQAEELLQKECP